MNNGGNFVCYDNLRHPLTGEVVDTEVLWHKCFRISE